MPLCFWEDEVDLTQGKSKEIHSEAPRSQTSENWKQREKKKAWK